MTETLLAVADGDIYGLLAALLLVGLGMIAITVVVVAWAWVVGKAADILGWWQEAEAQGGMG